MRHRALPALLAFFPLACDEEASPPGAPDTPLAPISSYDGPRAPVEIRFDGEGVPHIYAKDDLDLFFAAGYQQAVDRLHALEIGRRAAVGRLAEVFGPDRLSGDLQARVIGFRRWAEASVAHLAAERPIDHNLLVAFTAGVNRRIAEIRAGEAEPPAGLAALGVTPEPMDPADLLAMGLRIQFGFSETLDYELLSTVLHRLVRDAAAVPVHRPASDTFYMGASDEAPLRAAAPAPAAKARITPEELRRFVEGLLRFRDDLGVGEGSNAWAIAGAHTADGRPMLANDSHARLRDPNAMYLLHLNSADAGGSFDVMGYAFVGVPGVQVGHNRRLAWGATTAFADTTDVWDVEVDGDAVRLGGRRLPIEAFEEVIRVRQPDGTFTERTLTVRTVPGVGVLLPEELLPVPRALVARGALLLGWPGFKPLGDLLVFLDFDRAESLDDFRGAVDRQETGMQNWHAITAEGIALRTGSLVPDRGPVDGRPSAAAILDGADPATAWTGAFLPRARLPFIDGGRPFIASANNDPWGHTADGDPLNDPFYYGAFFAPGFRAGRLERELAALTARGGVTREEMQALQLDVTSDAAERLIPRLAAAMEGRAEEPALVAAKDRLVAWDARMQRDSREAALFRIWLAYLSKDILADDLGVLFEAVEQAQPVFNVKFTILAIEDEIEALLDGPVEDRLVAALGEAVAEMERRGQPTWGDVHRSLFVAPDGGESLVATDGGDTTLNVSQCVFWKDGALQPHCVADDGPVYRHVTLIGEDGVPETWSNQPASNAGTTEDWIEGRYARWPFRRAEVEAATVRVVTLEP